MSKFHKSCLALAVAFALPAAAFAAEVNFRDGVNLGIHAQEAVKNAASTAANAGYLDYDIVPGDQLVGRTKAVVVKVSLDSGEFVAFNPHNAQVGTWTISNVGGNPGYMDFTMTPSGTASMHNGALFSFKPGDLKLRDLPTGGGTVSAHISIIDPTTGATLVRGQHDLMTVSDGTHATVTAVQAAKIDVAAGRVRFVGNTDTVQLGYVDVGYVDGDPTRTGIQKVSIEGSGAVANGDAASTKTDQIVFAPADSLFVILAAEDASAFTPIAGAANQGSVGFHISAPNGACTAASPKFEPGLGTGLYSPNTLIPAAGARFRICGVVNGQTAIANKGFEAMTYLTFASQSMTQKIGPLTPLATLQHNGPVVQVAHFNPASNADQQSYLRITNTSDITGRIIIEGICDNGIASTTPANFQLDKQKSILLTSADIENGNPAKGLARGLGACPAGKTRLTVTGEVGSMTVQNFLRNVTTGGMINTNVNNQN